MKKLDARRLLCPMPVIKVQDTINEMQPNEELEVTCTDPGALNDIPTWCRINGHEVLSTKEVADEIILIIKVGES
ncbi:MAG: sulfurtransferase TusA family protein [Thiohalomonadales bacterium]